MPDYNSPNNLDTNFEMLSIPHSAFHNKKQRTCPHNISPETICYANTVFFTVLLLQFFIVYVVFAIYASDLNTLMIDAKNYIHELSMILPEVSNVLQIVRQICAAPEYAPYCHSEIDIV